MPSSCVVSREKIDPLLSHKNRDVSATLNRLKKHNEEKGASLSFSISAVVAMTQGDLLQHPCCRQSNTWPNVRPSPFARASIDEKVHVLLQKGRAMKQGTISFILVLKQRYRGTLVALLLATGLFLAGSSYLPTAHAAAPNPTGTSEYHGCAPGYVCIYPQDKGWNGDQPSLKYYYYGVYQLSNQYGRHYIVNNQYADAWVDLCTDWSGTEYSWIFSPHTWNVVDFTPINSIKVAPNAK
jgi:hypothetical protein